MGKLRYRMGIALALVLFGACSDNEGSLEAPLESADIKRGGRLYDEWWAVPDVLDSEEPDTNPAYEETSGTQTGSTTWRCKECHGWDYRGKEGAYGSGSHATGVTGLLVRQSKSPEELFESIKHGVPDTAMTAFEDHLSDQDIWDLVLFIREGMVDISSHIDAPTKKPVDADASAGKQLFATCALATCHGPNGKALNFGSAEEPEYVGTIAVDNPSEFFHKVRAGQPGTDMPSAITDTKWSIQQIMDTLAHAQTLPTE